MVRYVRACITAPSMVVRTNEASSRRSTPLGMRGPASSRHCSIGRVGLVQLERERPDGTGVKAVGHDEPGAVARQEREDALDGVRDVAPRGVEQHRVDPLAVGPQHGDEEVLFRREEVVEAAGMDVRRAQDVLDRGRAIALFGEELERGSDQTVPGLECGGHSKVGVG